MHEEMQALRDHKTWTLVEPSTVRQKLIYCRYVFKVKPETRATKQRHKARLVAKGFQQRRGVDFNETYAPVAKLSSIRLLLAHAHTRGLVVSQVDVKNPFLNSKLDEEIYMRQPKGFVNMRHPNHVCKLRRTIYGLKQAARGFYSALCAALGQCQLCALRTDPAVFFGQVDKRDTWVVAYVDDLLIIGFDNTAVDFVKSHLRSAFLLKDLGRAPEFVGIALVYDEQRGTLCFNQTSAIRRALKKFNMSNSKPISSPMEKSVVAHLRSDSEPAVNVPYREAIGSLLYIATCTRPDIAYAVSTLAQFCEAPTTVHWSMVKRVFRYMRVTASSSLVYSRRGARRDTGTFIGYSGSDWAGLPDRKSTSGSILLYDGCVVTWKSRKQGLVAMSTTEAKMIAVVEAFKEQKVVHKLFEESSNIVYAPWLVYCDNQAVIQVGHDSGYTGRAKHIELRYLAIQDVLHSRNIELKYCASDDNLADIFTKALLPCAQATGAARLHLAALQ